MFAASGAKGTKPKLGSMRQIPSVPSAPKCRNASTCGSFMPKSSCARGFQRLPHIIDRLIRKCGEKMRSANQTPVLDSCDLRFCWKNRSARGKFRFFPALPKFAIKTHRPEAHTDKYPSETAIHQGNRVGAVVTVKTHTKPLPVTSTQIIEHLPGDSTAEICQKQHTKRIQA